MILNFIFKKVNAETEEEKLKWSVIYGWSLIGMIFLSYIIIGLLLQLPANIQPKLLVQLMGWICIISFILFMFRYTSTKPFLGAAAAGITTITFAAILDSLTNRRDGSFTFGAMLGVIAVLLFICLKNIVVSLYYLIRETIRLRRHIKSGQQLDSTLTN
ncbi:hypothetical protein ABE073_17100 [Lederbergia citrisecunda]|uniref:hypothetical protein n=1 Tax=Lederbergia citrisecunda TaxID=2833583 RepID=UPI003D2B732B